MTVETRTGTSVRGGRSMRWAMAAVTAAALLLTGCAPFGEREPRESVPTGEAVAPDLREFYEQEIAWEVCHDRFDCGSVRVPLDWADPGRQSIEVALIRLPASGTPSGSLLVNPGGPGASGVDFVRDSSAFAVSEQARANFDVVGFDPRGVGASSAVSCYEDPDEFTSYLYDVSPLERGSEEWLDEGEAEFAEFGARCLELTGELLGFVDTNSAARDLDVIRAVLGDEKLNYLGFSYGTLLGATYASFYPDRTGRLVLDGAIDPDTTEFEVVATQAQGFESALRAYLASCVGTEGCPFRSSTVDGAVEEMADLFAAVERSPLRASDGRMLGADALFTAVITPLYNQSSWPALSGVIATVRAGDASEAFRVADIYYGRNPDGTFADNSTEAFIAINCLDYQVEATRDTLDDEAAELARLAPLFGPLMSWGGTSCDSWPFESNRVREPIAAEGSAPIVVVGTTNDPATPYEWAVALSEQLENGHLVTFEGEGHTAYNSDQCVTRAVDSYLIDGELPEPGFTC